MSRLKVAVANERFLSRFGVDRILLLLAERLKATDFEVSFLFLRAQEEMLVNYSSLNTRIVVPPAYGISETEAFVCEHVLRLWKDDQPDVLIVGGWPFFELAGRSSACGVRSIFIDAGAVPHDGFPDDILPVQLEVRRLRQVWLPTIDLILPISRFIANSQTYPDRGTSEGVKTVLLGGDHLRIVETSDGFSNYSEPVKNVLRLVEDINLNLIIMLGRFEETGYKNSYAVFEIFRQLSRSVSNSHLIVLTGPEKINIPGDLTGYITALPFITDAELQAIMSCSTLGLSVSLWEGFNLPIVEMQELGKPVLAFNLGAHPEVICDPWFLCDNSAEMVDKSIAIITKNLPSPLNISSIYERDPQRLKWKDTLDQWTKHIYSAIRDKEHISRSNSRVLLIDVSNSARDPGNSGVIRVTRRLCAELESNEALRVLFIRWSPELQTYVLLSAENERYLGLNAGPYDWIGRTASSLDVTPALDSVITAMRAETNASPILFFPEIALDGSNLERVNFANQRGYRIAGILYDLLPIYHSEYVDPNVQAAFPNYLEAMSRFDAVWPISEFSSNEFKKYIADNNLPFRGSLQVSWLPGQFSNVARAGRSRDSAATDIDILCVCTLEPRKNHITLLKAYEMLVLRRPDLSVVLTLVGNRYAGGDELAEAIETIIRRNPKVDWRGVLPDSEIANLYKKASFSVYPSLVEGYGLPIVESLWMNCPCVCHNSGVMSELAAEGGCLPVDMTKPEVLSVALEQMATDSSLRDVLKEQASSREIPTWSEYSKAISDLLFHL